jgi:hypothetical protein
MKTGSHFDHERQISETGKSLKTGLKLGVNEMLYH